MSALVKFEGGGQIAERPTFDLAEIQQIGTIFVKSGFFQDSKDASQAIVKIMAGAELGFGPMASMTGIYIVKGKVSLSANLMAAAVKRSRKYDYKVREITAKVCRIEFFEGKDSLGVSEFTIEEAQAGGLTGNDTWKKFPRNMLYSRAMSNGVKWYCADCFSGPVYTPEELGEQVTEEGEPTAKNIKREYPDIKPVAEAVPDEREPLKARMRALVPDWTDRAFDAMWGKKYAKMEVRILATVVAEKEAAAEKVRQQHEAEAAGQVVEGEVVTEQDASKILTVESKMKVLETWMPAQKVGKLVLGFTKGEELESLDDAALDQLIKDLDGAISEMRSGT